MPRIKSRQIVSFALILILGIGSVWQINRFLLHQNHTPYRSLPLWVSSKVSGGPPYSGLMGSYDFINSRQGLAGDHLNLGVWHGYHELSVDQVGDVKTLRFRFRIESGGYLWIFYDQHPEFRRGVRLSRNPNFRSGRYELDPEGLLIRQKSEPWDLLIADDHWHRFSLERQGTEDRLLLDGHFVKSWPAEPWLTAVTFRAGAKGTSIDDVDLKTSEFELHENFSPPVSLKVFELAIALYVFLVVLFVFPALFSRWRLRKEGAVPFVSAQLTLFLILCMIQAFDAYWWSEKYFYNKYTGAKPVPYQQVLNPIEAERGKLADALQRYAWGSPHVPVVSQIQDSVLHTLPGYVDSSGFEKMNLIDPEGTTIHVEKSEKPKPGRTVFFLGTSQTWGAGARDWPSAWPQRMIRQLNQRYPHCRLQALNVSVCGSRLPILLENYLAQAAKWKPFAMILNLGSNDSSDAESFRAALNQVLQFNRKNGIKSLISFEPQSLADDMLRGPAYEALGDVVDKEDLHFFDTNRYFRNPKVADAGLLYWDVIHFDNAGHVLMAKIMAQEFGADLCGGPKPHRRARDSSN